MIQKIKKHTISFRHAFDGLIWCLKTQPNYKIHLTLSFLSIVVGIYLRISYFEMLLVLFLITTGLVVETINTGFEQTTDAIDRKIREDIKIAKDVAAAAMLVYAFGSTIIAGFIFIPRLINLILK
jgi:diacylglycerol kinase